MHKQKCWAHVGISKQLTTCFFYVSTTSNGSPFLYHTVGKWLSFPWISPPSFPIRSVVARGEISWMSSVYPSTLWSNKNIIWCYKSFLKMTMLPPIWSSFPTYCTGKCGWLERPEIWSVNSSYGGWGLGDGQSKKKMPTERVSRDFDSWIWILSCVHILHLFPYQASLCVLSLRFWLLSMARQNLRMWNENMLYARLHITYAIYCCYYCCFRLVLRLRRQKNNKTLLTFPKIVGLGVVSLGEEGFISWISNDIPYRPNGFVISQSHSPVL